MINLKIKKLIILSGIIFIVNSIQDKGSFVFARRIREIQLAEIHRLFFERVKQYGLLPVVELERRGVPVFWASVDYNAYRSVTGLILNPIIAGHYSKGHYEFINGEFGHSLRFAFERGIDIRGNSILKEISARVPEGKDFDQWLREEFKDRDEELPQILQPAYLEEILLSDPFSFLNLAQMRPGLIISGREIKDMEKIRNSVIWIAPAISLIGDIITRIGSPHGEIHVSKVETREISYILAPVDIYSNSKKRFWRYAWSKDN